MISQTPKAAADITLAEIDNLTSDPSSFIGETCFKRWIIGGVDKGVCKGEVAAYDDTRTGPKDRPWAIAWDDGGKSNLGRRGHAASSQLAASQPQWRAVRRAAPSGMVASVPLLQR